MPAEKEHPSVTPPMCQRQRQRRCFGNVSKRAAFETRWRETKGRRPSGRALEVERQIVQMRPAQRRPVTAFGKTP